MCIKFVFLENKFSQKYTPRLELFIQSMQDILNGGLRIQKKLQNLGFLHEWEAST